jgi:hypothetical protein
VPDLAAIVAALTQRGVAFERITGLPQDAPAMLTTPEGARVAWLRDPDGNLLSLVQYPVRIE